MTRITGIKNSIELKQVRETKIVILDIATSPSTQYFFIRSNVTACKYIVIGFASK